MLGFSKNNDEKSSRAIALRFGLFESKKQAFDYFFAHEGKSAEEAERLADIIARARGVPDFPREPENAFDKIKSYAKQANELYNEYPKTGEFIAGVLVGGAASLGGAIVGSKISETKPPAEKCEINNNVEPIEINYETESV